MPLTVTLVVTDTDTGYADAVTRTEYITVGLNANFVGDPQFGSAPLTVQFTDATQGINSTASYRWDFGDDTALSYQQNPSHTYVVTGLFTVVLWVTDTQTGLTDVETKTQYISVGDARTISYRYDHLGRLVEADYSSGEKFEYAYDAVGNRTTSAALAGAARDTVTLGGGPVATSYQYDAANRLTNAGGVAYSWDERGNLRSDGTYTYTWSAAGRLTATTDGTTTVQFDYDGDGNRLARQVEGGTLTTYTQDVGLGLPESIAERQGTAITLYLHPSAGSGQALPSVIAWDDGTAWHYGLADHLGSLRQVVDDTGAVESASGYRPFGEAMEGDGEPYGFTGEMAETGLGLVFLRARWYQPGVGRFLSRDAWRGSVSRPGSLNGYAYVLNDPVGYTDPSGHCRQPGECLILLESGYSPCQRSPEACGYPGTWDSITAATLSKCYFEETGHIRGWEGLELSWLAELLWDFSLWVGGQNVFQEVFIAEGKGITGIRRITNLDLAVRNNPQHRGSDSGSLGMTPFSTGLVTIYDAARSDSAYDSAKDGIQGTLAHEFIHGLQRAFPQVVSAFVSQQRGYWELLSDVDIGYGIPTYRWREEDAPKIPVTYAHGNRAHEVMANVAAYAVVFPFKEPIKKEARKSHSWGWDTFIQDYVGLLYEWQVTGIAP